MGCGTRVLGLSLSDPKMLDFCDRMVLHNPKTGNFGTLVTLAATLAHEVCVCMSVCCLQCETDVALAVADCTVRLAARH